METERLVLRPFRAGDEPDIVRHANSRAIWLGLQDLFPHPYTEAAAASWIRHCQGQEPAVNFAICLAGEVIGAIGLTLRTDVFRFGADVGYWIGEAHWGNGYATEALRGISGYAFETLGLRRLSAGAFSNNPASARVLEKAGFESEGTERAAVEKDGEILDHLLYGKLRADVTRS
jgi:ribosomal-protein-alanine N-acetyltransferase